MAKFQSSGPINKCSKKKERDKKKRDRQKKASRTYREKIRQDPVKYEQQKLKDKERKMKSRRNAKPLNDRQLRKKRKLNRDYMRQYRLKHNMDKNDLDEDPLSGIAPLLQIKSGKSDVIKETESKLQDENDNYFDVTNISQTQESRSYLSKDTNKRAEMKRLRSKFSRLKAKLEEENQTLQRKIWTLEKRQTRKRKALYSPSKLTPKRKLHRLTSGKFVNSNIKKELFVGLVVQEECKKLKQNLLKEKKTEGLSIWSKFLTGRIVKKYKLLNQCKDILPSTRSARNGRKWMGGLSAKSVKVKYQSCEVNVKKKEAVVNFLCSDKASYCAPGKKDYVRVQGEKLQKRYLNETLKNLYPIFLTVSPLTASFAFFCKHRPKNVVPPKFSGRDTCLCTKCDNFKLLTSSILCAKVINKRTKDEIIQSLVCDTNNVNCLLRNCKECRNKTVKFDVRSKGKIVYQKWISKTIMNKNKGKKSMKISKKESIESTVKNVVNIFKESLPNYMTHIGRVVQQRSEWDRFLQNIGENDVGIIMDWSESWECKYHREVQGMHFGGSHKKLSLHTGRVYRKDFSESFCTVSEDLSHGPRGIYCHLKPILKKYVTNNTEIIHFKSDGPSSQYRSSNMFYVLTKWITELVPNVRGIFWNFSEAGHGKSVADGVGGTVKRTADSIISHGADITDVTSFVKEVSARCPRVFLKEVTDAEMKKSLAQEIPKIPGYKGTMNVHQYYWTRERPSEIIFKSLSCYKCDYKVNVCAHFNMGKPWIMVRVEERNRVSKSQTKEVGAGKNGRKDSKSSRPLVQREMSSKPVRRSTRATCNSLCSN